MTLASLFTLIGVWMAVCIAPGPDVVQVMRVASRSTRAGLFCTAGNTTGTAVWLIASLAGMSALIASQPSLLGLLQLVGGAFLIWMGAGSIRSGVLARRQPAKVVETEKSSADSSQSKKLPVLTAAHSFRLGLFTNLSNPKAVVFFGAVFAQFIRPGMSLGWTVMLGVILISLSTSWFVTVTFIMRSFSTWLTKHFSYIDIIAGYIFAILGLVMVYQGIIQLI